MNNIPESAIEAYERMITAAEARRLTDAANDDALTLRNLSDGIACNARAGHTSATFERALSPFTIEQFELRGYRVDVKGRFVTVSWAVAKAGK